MIYGNGQASSDDMRETTAMLEQSRALAASGEPNAAVKRGPAEAITVETQFGPMTFDAEQAIHFPHGMLGFGGHTRFGLANLPDPAYGNFKLMQCLDGSGLAFLVLPVANVGDAVAKSDIDEAFEALAIPAANGAALVIVTVRKHEDKVTLSVNLRAPVLIDTKTRKAVQYVLANSAYSIRHEL